jgi:hypothetical protein
METKITKIIQKEIFIFITIAVVCTNLFGSAIYWCYLAVPIFLILLKENILLCDKYFLIIFLFSITYSLCLLINDYNTPNSLLFGYFLFPPIFYFLGQYLIKKYPFANIFYFINFFICISLSLFPFLANLNSILVNGFMPLNRNISSFWNEQNSVSATIMGSYFAINLTLIPLILKRKKNNNEKKYAVISLVLVFMSIVSIMNMSNRTGLLIMLLSLVTYIFFSENKRKTVLVVFLLISIIILIYYFNIWGSQTWFENSNYFYRLTNTSLHEEGSRKDIWFNSMISFFSHPLGNYRSSEYAHNLWLDTGLRAGIFAIIPLLLFTIISIFKIIQLITNAHLNEFLKLMVIGIFLAFFVTFFMEPILEGFYIFFFIFCLYFGMIIGIIKHSEENFYPDIQEQLSPF